MMLVSMLLTYAGVSPEDSMVKNKLLTYAGECWRGFKTQLTCDYIHHPSNQAKPSYAMYPFIYQDVWEKFIKSRATPEFLAKSKKGKIIVTSQKIRPRECSRARENG